MQATDFRNANFNQLRSYLTGMRERVYFAVRNLGPATTSELAERSGISILTLRPRVTELLDLGFVRIVKRPGPFVSGREGIYEAVPVEEVRAAVERRAAEPVQDQALLKI